jgi:hypothetical protein
MINQCPNNTTYTHFFALIVQNINEFYVFCIQMPNDQTPNY